MKKILVLLVMFTLTSSYCKSQTFSISDVTSQNVSASDLQKKKLLMLGATVRLTFFDSSVKLEVTTTDNNYSKIVLDKTLSSNVFSYKDGNMTYTLTINKSLSNNSYINSAKLVVKASVVPYDVIYSYNLKRY